MARTRKRSVLELLTKARLVEIARAFDLGVPASEVKESFVNAIGQSRAASFRKILRQCSLNELRRFCDEYELRRSGSKAEVVARLLGEDEQETTQHDHLPLFSGAPEEPPTVTPSRAIAARPRTEHERGAGEQTSPPTNRAQAGFSASPNGGSGEDSPDPPAPDVEPLMGSLVVKVQRRKPKLAWHGMERNEVAAFVPTQVVEVIHPGRAMTSGDQQAIDARTVPARSSEPAIPSRLIWTNDNLVALRTLLDERDPATRDYRYRGRIDVIYIDPPFMVNNDFRGDNSIDIDIDADAGVRARKEPSLVEILAYKDTWREGLDTFLSMLRSRLVLLKDLLAASGTIYVHLDWHAAHYVKVLMDGIFGYENFRNEIVWRRSVPKSLMSRRLPNNHDVLLAYGNGVSPHWNESEVFQPYDENDLDEKTAKKYSQRGPDGRRYQLTSLLNPNPDRPNLTYEFLGVTRVWRWTKERMTEAYEAGLVVQPSPGAVPRYKRYLDEQRGKPFGDVWTDISPVNSQALDRLGWPTQKPVALIERALAMSARPGGLVLDCFVGSGTTAEAAERLGLRWIGIDNSKYAIHLARKRMVQLHGQGRKSTTAEARGLSERIEVKPFSIENMGVYQRAEAWQGFQTQRSRYRDEMVRVFGGEVTNVSQLLHGIKRGAWIHIGPLDAPVAVAQVWSIAREAQRTDRNRVEILSADFNTLAESERNEVKEATGIQVTIRIIPKSAIDEVARRIRLQHTLDEEGVETMAIPAFYAPLSIVLAREAKGRHVRLDLRRCEVDIESFLASQRPVGLKSPEQTKTAKQKKKATAEMKKWLARVKELEDWLAKANTWQKFVDFWAVDWDYGRRTGHDEKPIFETQWQSFRVRKSKSKVEDLVFHAEFTYSEPGKYRIAARVTDVFGNDGIATVTVNIR